MMSQMGDNIEHVISYWLLFQKFHSPVLGGFAVISHWTPFLFFSVYFGALADRHDCRRVIQTAQCMYAAVSLTWGILFITDTIQVWHACVLLVIHGMAGVLGAPGSQLIIHDIVGREYLQSAVRLNSTGRNLAVLFGPAVGGATMLLFGPPIGLFVNALMFVPMTVFMFILPYTGHGRDTGMSGRAPRLTLTTRSSWRARRLPIVRSYRWFSWAAPRRFSSAMLSKSRCRSLPTTLATIS